MVVVGLTLWTLAACEPHVVREPRPDPATFVSPRVDTGAEELEPEPHERMGGRNHPPIVRQARISPSKPKRSDNLQVLAEMMDKDGDLLRTQYRWYINDRPLSGATGKKLTSGAYEKGDIVTVELIVTDGPNDTVFRSQGVTIRNSPPVMKKPPGGAANLDGLKLNVTDPDGDSLHYSLTGAPPGLSVDQDGVLHFSGSDEIKVTKTYTTRIIAEDSEGEQAIWELKMTLNAATPTERRFTPGAKRKEDP
jgi:hypothetical protein